MTAAEQTQREMDRMRPVEEYIAHLPWTSDASDHDMALVNGNLRAFWHTIADQPRVVPWPAELTPDLLHILGMMCFQLAGPAHLYRDWGGAEIKPRAEDEQAFMLHKLLGFWLEHGAGWTTAAQAEIDALKNKRAAAMALRA